MIILSLFIDIPDFGGSWWGTEKRTLVLEFNKEEFESNEMKIVKKPLLCCYSLQCKWTNISKGERVVGKIKNRLTFGQSIDR